MDLSRLLEEASLRGLTRQIRNELTNNRHIERIERARGSLLNFTNFTFPQYIAEPAHKLIADTLDACVRGDIKKLMIFAPPQHGKSELVSVRFPAYWLGRRPNDPIILTSYGADLAYSKSRQARAIVESDEYATLFPNISTRRDSRAVDHWEIAPPYRGGMLAAGVGGPVTGHGAMLGIIDDPFENWEQAQSEKIREKVWEWYRTTFRTRVWENGVIILIMTRWHEDDLAGRLLADQGKEWTVLRLTAIAETQEERDENNKRLGLPIGEPDPVGREPSEPLCPKRKSKEYLAQMQRDVGPLAWAGEFQGVPRAAEGNRFKRAWFPIVDAIPANIKKRVRYWDKAATPGAGCFTVGLLMDITDDGRYIIEDVVRGQWASDERDRVIKQTAQLDREKYNNSVQIWIEQEPGSSGVDAMNAFFKLLSGFPIHGDKVSGSKDVRLEPYAVQCGAGNVELFRGEWNGKYIDEMCAVPNGKFRDQGDASSGAFNKLAFERAAGVGW